MTLAHPLPFIERAYRLFDRWLFGPMPELLGHSATSGLSVVLEGRPLPQVVEAVRQRLGQPGGTVEAEIWHNVGESRELLFRAQCALDHRSLARSVTWVQAKVPALLQAARARLALGVRGSTSHSTRRGEPLEAVTLIGRLGNEILARLRFRDQWLVQLHARSDDGYGVGPLLASIVPPPDRFWADPFLCRREGRLWLFVEELPFGAANAHLSVVELDDSGQPMGTPQRILVEPWHLSYPFLWEEDGKLFMIPESSAHASVDLYECTNFPLEWRKRCTLIEGAVHADATVVRYCGRLWMFSSGALAAGNLYDELHLHWAESIEGPWRPHPLNPVKIDARSARPAGRMWVDADGCIVRPVQDCSTIYGGAMRLQRVTALDDEDFEEVDLGEISVPTELAVSRFHTLNADGGMVVVDAMRRVPRRR
jgi:hypothetical protein